MDVVAVVSYDYAFFFTKLLLIAGDTGQDNGYVYCPNVQQYQTNAYYAPLSSSGFGTWTSTNFLHGGSQGASYYSCITYNGYIYCVGGYTGSATVSNVYYAAVSGSGVGSWSSTNTYPRSIASEGCAPSNP